MTEDCGHYHYHCPNDCEKPQPFRDGDRVLCGRCLHEKRGEVECFLCTPETCDDGETT